MEQPEVAVVRAVYDAFTSADVTAIIELFSPDATVYQSAPCRGSGPTRDMTASCTFSTG
ncbi:MAG: hypothetical protein JWO98_4966 [Frankiales bacterium]|nr:hypothetical protein [Frankiales bacterium]